MFGYLLFVLMVTLYNSYDSIGFFTIFHHHVGILIPTTLSKSQVSNNQQKSRGKKVIIWGEGYLFWGGVGGMSCFMAVYFEGIS